MNLIGLSTAEIEAALEGVKRKRLIAIIQEHVTIEPFFLPEHVATARGMPRRAVIREIKEQRLRAHLVAINRYRIPRSALLEWDAATLVSHGDATNGK